MSTTARFAQIAAAAGDPARSAMLQALMDGRALTAAELAQAAGIAPQTASGHLARLVDLGFLAVTRQGRHRYHRIANPAIARMLEGIMAVAAAAPAGQVRMGPRDAALRAARTCYDHLAGRLGVAIAEGLERRGHVEIDGEAGLVTEAGVAALAARGIALDSLGAGRTSRSGRVLCRPCLDWSERRPHLAGTLGAALCTHAFAQGWTRRLPGGRAVLVTPEGRRAFAEAFGARLDDIPSSAA